MLELIGKVKYKYISQASTEVITLLEKLKEDGATLAVAEVGLGIGATTREILKTLKKGDTLHIFDFKDTVDALLSDFPRYNLGDGINIKGYSSERKVHSSYSWHLAKISIEKMDRGETTEIYDLAYLDGAHTFLYDSSACCLLKQMVKPGGYLVLDDVYWSHAKSPTWNPTNKPHVRDILTDEQIETPNVEMVKRLFLDNDPDFTEIFLTDDRKPARAIFQKKDKRSSVLSKLLRR